MQFLVHLAYPAAAEFSPSLFVSFMFSPWIAISDCNFLRRGEL
eukprot:15148.XXX_1143227_1143355_1 [CDS] Oithona nana genome sequencing.